jgi:chromatin remodeling complex protein RSC6
MHPRTLDRRLKKVMEANLAPTLTKADKPLPPLLIDREDVLNKVAESHNSVAKEDSILETNRQLNSETREGMAPLSS